MPQLLPPSFFLTRRPSLLSPVPKRFILLLPAPSIGLLLGRRSTTKPCLPSALTLPTAAQSPAPPGLGLKRPSPPHRQTSVVASSDLELPCHTTSIGWRDTEQVESAILSWHCIVTSPAPLRPSLFPLRSHHLAAGIFSRVSATISRLRQAAAAMDKGIGAGLFANDGSFMERFKQMQQEKAARASSSAPPKAADPNPAAVAAQSKRPLEVKGGEVRKAGSVMSGGKLAFSLKKNKVAVAPVKFPVDEDEEDAGAEKDEPGKLQRFAQADALVAVASSGVVAPSPPNDMTVKQVADKLASFVAKNGRQFEDVTRQRNPGDTPFKFLFDKNCSDYKYYEFWLAEEEKVLAQSKEAQASKHASSSTPSSRVPSGQQRSSFEQKNNYQTPASALYGAYEGSSSQGSSSGYGDPPKDPVALMEFYMKKAAQEERKRPPRQSKDEMPPPPSLQGPPKKGHHMGDFIPQEELEKFMARCNDAAAQNATKEAAEKAKIQADNIGHKLLSKMGWKEATSCLCLCCWQAAAPDAHAKWWWLGAAVARKIPSTVPVGGAVA
ncbi:hypothetical protein GUJ93_ZPchr0002g23274 [Zizania palustris]|uniref:SURP motif domain-containing protein n=1 Tax=Zizania palustris TaxID=103762 RepID=A0A8J5V359_ZIZPA|nr:hypothetical protein GUJ93_ZPchr0002g23274 [Zizania palustris]